MKNFLEEYLVTGTPVLVYIYYVAQKFLTPANANQQFHTTLTYISESQSA
jgi:hypothetical protein